MQHRIVLCGFSEFERRAMHFSFGHPDRAHGAALAVVDSLADADFAVVDADSAAAVDGVRAAGRIADAVLVGEAAPAGAAAHLRRPIDPTRILRQLDQLIARRTRDERVPAAGTIPVLDDAVDVAAGARPGRRASDPPERASDRPAPLTRGEARSAARAAARRARLATERADGIAAAPPRDVLVLDPDATSRNALGDLLQAFGFVIHPVASVRQAAYKLSGRHCAAIFVDVALDGSDRGEGLELLGYIRELPVPPGLRAPALVRVSGALSAADRVRASLAGFDAALVKPVGRGDVARALEACGVRLPADARRA